MFVEAIVLAAALSRPAPVPHCHPGPVSFKFVGAPGTSFRYSGRQYTVPRIGWIELAADGGDHEYEANGRRLPLDVWPIDEFGTRAVPLPAAAPQPDR